MTRSTERPVSPEALAGLPVALSGVNRMDENDKARAPEKRAAKSWDLREQRYGRGHGDWPDPLAESSELTQDELDLLHSQVPGHRWNGWRAMTGDESYYAACSCGWRSTDTGDASPMLRQVKGHLDAVRALRGWRPAARTAQAPGRDGQERIQELYAVVESQQRRLSQELEQSTDLLSASEEHADRLVVALEHAAARIAPEWAKTEASVRRAETLQHRAERARELRNGIVAAAAALAAITEEVAAIHLRLDTGREEAIDSIYGEQLIQPTVAKPSSGKAHDK